MKKCCVCENHNIEENADVLFIDEQGEYKELCPKCSKMMEVIENNENPREIRRAVYYFESLLNNIQDFEVKKYINNLIDKYDINLQNSVMCEEETNFENTQHENTFVKMIKLTILFLFFSAITMIFAFINSNNKSIVGRWQTSLAEEIEFFSNGRYVACDDFGETGTYFIENDRLQIIPEFDEPIVFDIEIRNDELMLYEDDDYEALILYRIK